MKRSKFVLNHDCENDFDFTPTFLGDWAVQQAEVLTAPPNSIVTFRWRNADLRCTVEQAREWMGL